MNAPVLSPENGDIALRSFELNGRPTRVLSTGFQDEDRTFLMRDDELVKRTSLTSQKSHIQLQQLDESEWKVLGGLSYRKVNPNEEHQVNPTFQDAELSVEPDSRRNGFG